MGQEENKGTSEPGAVEQRPITVWRWLLVGVYIVVGGSLVADPSQSGGLAGRLIAGMGAAAVLLAAAAGIALAFRRGSPSAYHATYARAFTSISVLLVCFGITFLAAVGRESQRHHHNSTSSPTGAQTSSPTPGDRARNALAAWMTSVPVGQQDKARAIHQLVLLKQGLGARPLDLQKLIGYAKAADRYARAYVADVRREPAANADVRSLGPCISATR